MDYEVDSILDNWFGESPEHSDDERNRIKHLYAPLRAMEQELIRLRKQVSEQSWRDNPDRAGGQFTQDEIDTHGRWI